MAALREVVVGCRGEVVSARKARLFVVATGQEDREQHRQQDLDAAEAAHRSTIGFHFVHLSVADALAEG